jgi:hypothetical protein
MGIRGVLIWRSHSRWIIDFNEICSDESRKIFSRFCKYSLPGEILNIISPYYRNNKFLLILNSWGERTDVVHFNGSFTDVNGNCTLTLDIILRHHTPYREPYDVYFFFLPYKGFYKKNYKILSNTTVALQTGHELSTR